MVDLPWTPAQKIDDNDAFRRAHGLAIPGAVRIRPADPTYNCMGFVFASRRAFVPPDAWSIIEHDDDYVRVADDEVGCGDVVTWHDAGVLQHVGLVVKVDRLRLGGLPLPSILSKWGLFGEYLHPVNAVPAWYGIDIGFWRVRRV